MNEKQVRVNSGNALANIPLISIIIPAYNADKYIRRTLESVLLQTYSNIEVIVVDDGSTDSTADCVSSLNVEDHRVLLISQENTGVSAARNRGLLAAKGDFVVFVDADDLLAPTCLNEAIARNSEINDVDCVFWRYDLVDEVGNYISNSRIDKATRKSIRKFPEMAGCRACELMLKKEIWICTGSIMIRKQMLLDKAIMYTRGCTHGEDQEFTLKCLSISRRVVGVNKVLSHYTQRSDSAVRAANLRLFHEIGAYRRLLRYFAGILNRRDISDYIEQQILPIRYVAVFRNLAKRGFEVSKLMSISANPFIRSQVRKYRINILHPINSLALLMFRFFPKLLIKCWAKICSRVFLSS